MEVRELTRKKKKQLPKIMLKEVSKGIITVYIFQILALSKAVLPIQTFYYPKT